jgi:RimJ/RimL family protein N-acetyltransferase
MRTAVVDTPTVSPKERTTLARIRDKITDRLRTGVYAKHLSYGLRRDLAAEFPTPNARIPVSIRPLREEDVQVLFPADQSHLAETERQELGWRLSFLRSGISRCFVAVDERNGEPCYFQWLIGPEENARLEPLKQFHRLAPDEALLENAYTPVHYRSKGIMPAAMARIAEFARESGLRYVTTFVGVENTPSLKGCMKAGFHPCLVRKQTVLGFNTIRFVDVSEMRADDARRQLVP